MHSVRMSPIAGSPALECALVDDTGTISVVFFGRRSIPGIEVGARMTVEGMVGEHRGRLALINPVYRLQAVAPPERATSLPRMRMSALFLRTLRDDPADADIDSHRLLAAGRLHPAGGERASTRGCRWAAGCCAAVEQIVREEMDAAGAQEVLLPIAQPLELWARTGRDKSRTARSCSGSRTARRPASACRRRPRRSITTLVAGEYSSYRDLPVNLYQINWKYRDELRPRFGLLRAREFLMKDAYSFHVDTDDLRRTYQDMYDAYARVFTRCGLTFRPVEAQAGEIGGDVNHEFMAVAAVGEDDFVWCTSCDYAANVEAARRHSRPATRRGARDRRARRAKPCTRPTSRASRASPSTSASRRRSC